MHRNCHSRLSPRLAHNKGTIKTHTVMICDGGTSEHGFQSLYSPAPVPSGILMSNLKPRLPFHKIAVFMVYPFDVGRRKRAASWPPVEVTQELDDL